MQDNFTKVCTTCQVPKTLDNFYNQRFGKFGKGSTCKLCASLQARIRNSQDSRKSSRRSSHLMRTYGITQEEYDKILFIQKEVCAICGKPNISGHPLCLDHNNITNMNRGLLCHNCNRALGLVGEDIQILENMIAYLKHHKLIESFTSQIISSNK